MSDDKTASGAKSARGRKAKIPQDLDLPATDVREIASEAPPAESVEAVPTPEAQADVAASETPPVETVEPSVEPSAEPLAEPISEPESAPVAAPPATPSKALPAVIGLVAGLIGGAGGAFILGKFPVPGAPQTVLLADRLTKTETALTEAKTREDALRAEIAALGSRLSGEGEVARKALESLDARATKLAQPSPDIDALKSRLGSLEGESKVLPKEVGVLGTKVENLQPKLDTLEKTVETLNGRMAAVGSKDALALANGRMAAQSLFEEEFGSGKPYAATLDLLTRMGGDASLIALVKPFAERGAPATKSLLSDFLALKPKAPQPTAGETSLMDRAKKAAFSLVEIRRTGDIAGKDDEAVFTRVESALAKADLNSAFAASGQFSPALAPTFAPWRTRLEARIKAGEAVGLLRKDAQAALARAAASVK